MEAGDNAGSWAPPINHQRIDGGAEGMFSCGDGRTKRAVAGDGNEIGKVREGIKPF